MRSRSSVTAHSAILAAFAALAACTRPAPAPTVPVPTAARADTAAPATTSPARDARDARAADDPFATFASLGRAEWTGPNEFRTADGRPGAAYWQQRADYEIAATLDTANGGSVRGQVTIRYTNNSPDTLRLVWLQLDQNLYRADSKGSALFPADSRWGVRGFQGGYVLGEVTAGGRPVTPHVDDTMMRLDLAQPLLPRGVVTIVVPYRFAVPEHGSDRMGRDGMLFQLAQWYPRMVVYDDVRGWNADPYLGQGEFYLEYGDIDYAVTVPAGYLVAGSGVLQNANEVLTAAQRERLARARTSTTPPGSNAGVVAIVTAAEAAAARTRAVAGTKTWRFRAERVRDVAWAGAPDFQWDATSWNGITCQAYHQQPKAGKAWESGAEQTCWSIRTYSQLFYPYPYPQATSVAGPVGGMEYPMFVMVHYGTADPSSIFGTIDHEQGHEWFPMLVGSNERRFAWQDEGFNTFINAFSLERRYPGQDVWNGYVRSWRGAVTSRTQTPLMAPPDHVPSSALGAMAYRKPGVVLLTLRNHVLGADAFDRAFREYTRRWAFRHPTPADFFRTVENVTGTELSWFWRSFWYTRDTLDIAVDSVSHRVAAGSTIASVALRRTTSIPFPVTMRLKLADGATRDVRLPVDVWARDLEHPTVTADVVVASRVVGVRLWPAGSVPDWQPANDVWGDAPAGDPVGPVTIERAGRVGGGR